MGLALIILTALFRFSDQILSPQIHSLIHFMGEALGLGMLKTLYIPGLGIMVLMGLFFAVGLVSLSRLGKRVIRSMESIVARIPLLGAMYKGGQDLATAIYQPDSPNAPKPVLAELQAGQLVIGFLTGKTEMPEGSSPEGADPHLSAVYVPSTPNLASGSLFFLPPKQVTPLSMRTQEAIKLVVSGGLTTPAKLSKLIQKDLNQEV